jgi:hypothetical protein
MGRHERSSEYETEGRSSFLEWNHSLLLPIITVLRHQYQRAESLCSWYCVIMFDRYLPLYNGVDLTAAPRVKRKYFAIDTLWGIMVPLHDLTH